MVQFHVLRCALCQTFQVLQVTKVSKWKCKLCGEKQSIIKVYGQGTGAECRKHVQKLNTLRGQIDQESQENCLFSVLSHSSQKDSFVSQEESLTKKEHSRNKNTSRWAQFLEISGDIEDVVPEDTPSGTNCQMTTDYKEFQQSNKRKRQEIEQTKNKWTKYSVQTNSSKSFNYKSSNNHIIRTNSNTQSSCSQVNLQHLSVNGNNTTGLSSSNDKKSVTSTSSLNNVDIVQAIGQVNKTEPVKASSSTINYSFCSRLSNSLNQETVSCSDVHPLKIDSCNLTKTKASAKNVSGTSLKWAAFLENNESDEDCEDELYSDNVSGPVFVTSLNEVNPVTNLSEDES
ncbi:UPF0544 protein [Biomphalaria glabrata]|uniref:MRN complex-interacting protein-like n=1 Tax=Biomphalaria glabrata TaxID=6526 RepID=A0A9U8E190_BIOGL|nr:MRN complex-interacting protein-like [Biomphalaria glabrata]KAI8737073.1 putative UPF0544 protein C5orf45 [Biomphalaria glabrata]